MGYSDEWLEQSGYKAPTVDAEENTEPKRIRTRVLCSTGSPFDIYRTWFAQSLLLNFNGDTEVDLC